MKKFLFKALAIVMAVMIFQLQAMAGSTLSISSTDEAAVNFDENEIYSSFDQVNSLVSYVSENENVTYADVASYDNSMVENVSSNAAVAMNTTNSDNPLILGAFWYGCMFTALGILVVAFVTDNDSDQVRKAVSGCLVTTVVMPVLYFIILLLASES
jgi:hypothetical protein